MVYNFDFQRLNVPNLANVTKIKAAAPPKKHCPTHRLVKFSSPESSLTVAIACFCVWEKFGQSVERYV